MMMVLAIPFLRNLALTPGNGSPPHRSKTRFATLNRFLRPRASRPEPGALCLPGCEPSGFGAESGRV